MIPNHPSKFSESVINALVVLLISVAVAAFIFIVLCSLGGCSTVKREASFKESAKVGLFPPLPWETPEPAEEVHPQYILPAFSSVPMIPFGTMLSIPAANPPPVAITNFDVTVASDTRTDTNQFLTIYVWTDLSQPPIEVHTDSAHLSQPNTNAMAFYAAEDYTVAYFKDYGTTNFVIYGGTPQ